MSHRSITAMRLRVFTKGNFMSGSYMMGRNIRLTNEAGNKIPFRIVYS